MSCRLYPLGRVILGDKAVIFMPEAQKDCALGSGGKQIVRAWLESSGLTIYFKLDRPWKILDKMDANKFNRMSVDYRDPFFRLLYDIDSIVEFKKLLQGKSPDETITAVYELCEAYLKKIGCLGD
jgi:hypothetical protein